MSDPHDTMTAPDPRSLERRRMYHHDLTDTIRPDHPAEAAVRVLAHWGGLEFVEVTSMTGPDEDWTLQLDREQARALADALQIALDRIDRGRAEVADAEAAEAPARIDRGNT